MREKIIIVEGAQGVGKTTATDYLRHIIPYTNLYRLSGNRDSSKEGYNKAKNMYDNLLDYMKTLEHNSINLLFDRTFFTEEVYCRLGYKEYSFTDQYNKLLNRLDEFDFDIYYITLYLEDESLFEKRLMREGKGNLTYAKFDIKNSINQQNKYLELAKEIEETSKNINVVRIATDTLEESRNKFKELFADVLK